MQNISQVIEVLRESLVKNESSGGEKMSIYYQQLKVSRTKNANIESEIKKSQKDLRRSMDRTRRAEMEFYHTYGVKYVSESELDVLTKEVADRGVKYKTCRAKLSQMEEERNVLQNTVMTLNNELESLGHELKERVDIAPSLENVTQTAEKLNLEKEVALEELSAVISEMNKKLLEKKSVLGPKLEEMRKRRLKLDELQSAIESRRLEIEKELEPIEKAIADRAHEFNNVSEEFNCMELDIKRVDDEMSRIEQLMASGSIIKLQSQLSMKEREKSLIEKELKKTDMQNFQETKRRYDIVISLISSRESDARGIQTKTVLYDNRGRDHVFV
jgi:chromosome segregation ATPase